MDLVNVHSQDCYGPEWATPAREVFDSHIRVKQAEDAGCGDYEEFVAAMVHVVMQARNRELAVALQEMLAGHLVGADVFNEAQLWALDQAGIGMCVGSRLVLAPSFCAEAEAWRRVLRGESEDFGSCRPMTLDAWGSALLAALLVDVDIHEIRDDLRKYGVAAFGMLAA